MLSMFLWYLQDLGLAFVENFPKASDENEKEDDEVWLWLCKANGGTPNGTPRVPLPMILYCNNCNIEWYCGIRYLYHHYIHKHIYVYIYIPLYSITQKSWRPDFDSIHGQSSWNSDTRDPHDPLKSNSNEKDTPSRSDVSGCVMIFSSASTEVHRLREGRFDSLPCQVALLWPLVHLASIPPLRYAHNYTSMP